MTTLDAKLSRILNEKSHGYWSERTLTQLEYAIKVSKVNDHLYDDLLNEAIQEVSERLTADGAITKETTQKTEFMLREMAELCKSYEIMCAAHAHIDMNWMWPWNETVAVVLDTFRTMLDLLDEYPQFTFSQSQAATYQIVEQYAPEMLQEIKSKVREGRWEVTASTWVEPDKNMPSGESLVRQILYTKRYLAQLLGISPESLTIDFEPDTFGHSLNVPEILANASVKYYYHCRGYDGHHMYKWVAPSGQFVIAYREPIWYNASIEAGMALYVPEFCKKYGLNTMLKVYGVGDHGGGPTRRDLERLLDMAAWPIYPTIQFGTFREYFAEIEKMGDRLPVVDGELNFVFTGCYTTQTRIKKANRAAEGTLNEAEAFSAFFALDRPSSDQREAFAAAWKNVLFNQFHDIIPGSGVVDTREYAMGLYQTTMARANIAKSMVLKEIVKEIDTTAFADGREDIRETVSEGAGAGFGIAEGKTLQAERGYGTTRIFHVFNSAWFERREAVEITVWDWPGDTRRIVVQDPDGNVIPHQLLEQGIDHYWGHHYLNLLVYLQVPSYGYSTCIMTESDEYEATLSFPKEPRVEKLREFVLENSYLRAAFDAQNGSIRSLIDKRTGMEQMSQTEPTGVFRFVEEDDSRGMTAWVVGQYKTITNMTENVKVKVSGYTCTPIRQSLTLEMIFHDSKLKAEVSLDFDIPRLNYRVECDWREFGRPKTCIPQLNFYLPLAYKCSSYKYDVPFGIIERPTMDMDVPGNSFIVGIPDDRTQTAVMLVTDSKYGFRGVDNAVSVTLIRSSFDPDPYPEIGIHKFSFAVCLVDGADNQSLMKQSYQYSHPANVVSSKPHGGTRLTSGAFLKVMGESVAVSAIKMPEDLCEDKKLIIRMNELDGAIAPVSLHFSRPVKRAFTVDLNEKPTQQLSDPSVAGDTVHFQLNPFSVASICVEF